MKGEDHHHAIMLGDRWRWITAGGIIIIGVYFMYLVYSGAFSEHHEHGYHHPKLAHLRVRRKPMPWGDCAFLELRCWRKEGEFAEEHEE